MAKKAKVLKVNNIYKDLDATDNKVRHQALVIDKQNQLFKFSTPQQIHIVAEAVTHRWDNWQQFDDIVEKNAALFGELHQRFFSAPVPTDTDRITVSCYLWAKMMAGAEDRIKGSTTNPATPKDSKSRASLDTRIYIAVRTGEKTWPNAEETIKTPQALACLKIVRETATEKDGTMVCTEADLKKAVADRAAEIKTRQDPWRIFQYYRPSLVQAKLIQHD